MLPILFPVPKEIKNLVDIADNVINRDDKIVKAKKRGTERAAEIFKPNIRELRLRHKEFEKMYLKTDDEIKKEMDDLIAEIKALLKEHDMLVRKLQKRGIDTDNLGIKLLGRNKDTGKELSIFDSLSSLDTMSIISLPSGGCSITSLILEKLNDYSEYEEEQFEKQSKIWAKRIKKEIDVFNAQKLKAEKLIQNGKGNVEFYYNKIIELTEKITALKVRITMLVKI